MERPRKNKIKIGTEVTHVTRDSDTTFKVKKVKVTGGGAYCGGLPHSLLLCLMHKAYNVSLFLNRPTMLYLGVRLQIINDIIVNYHRNRENRMQ